MRRTPPNFSTIDAARRNSACEKKKRSHFVRYVLNGGSRWLSSSHRPPGTRRQPGVGRSRCPISASEWISLARSFRSHTHRGNLVKREERSWTLQRQGAQRTTSAEGADQASTKLRTCESQSQCIALLLVLCVVGDEERQVWRRCPFAEELLELVLQILVERVELGPR